MSHYGLLGHPLGHSLSPQLHKIIYNTLGIKASYSLFDRKEDELGLFFQELRKEDGAGTNVTIPYKEKVVPFLDYRTPVARAIGAVNTIASREGLLYGTNTDYDGIELTFKRQSWPIKGHSALVLGTGGASLAVEHFLKNSGIQHLTFVSRKTISHFKGHPIVSYKDLDTIKANYLINATPVGLYPHTEDCPIQPSQIENFDAVFDLIYNPSQTQLLRLAQYKGIPTSNGLDMLIGQAIKALAFWQNRSFTSSEIENLYQTILAQKANWLRSL